RRGGSTRRASGPPSGIAGCGRNCRAEPGRSGGQPPHPRGICTKMKGSIRGGDMPYAYKPFDYVPPPGVSAPEPRHRVVIVGAGPIGLAMAIELANHGVAAVVLDDNNVVSVGSRAICWSKRALEILDRLGVGAACVEKGVTWKVGRTFHRETEVFNFDLLPEDGHKMPAFVNLQQYWVEQYLVERAQELGIDLRWKNRVTG